MRTQIFAWQRTRPAHVRLLLFFLRIQSHFRGIVSSAKIVRHLRKKRLSRWYAPCIHTSVRRFFLLVFFCGFGLALSTADVWAEGLAPSTSRFYYQTTSGATGSARIIRRYWRVPVVHPDARVDSRLDPRLSRAASIAQERANARSKARCWRYVKEALIAAGVINSYPKTNYASQAGEELVRDYGFKRLPVRDQFAAPIGSVLVFGHGSTGHVVIRTKTGFVSDYWTKNRCKYPLVAVYGKFAL